MTVAIYAFWLSTGCVAYTYLLYPLILGLLARLRRPVDLALDEPAPRISIILAAHNEEGRIGARIRELGALLAARTAGGELIVVSDGSTDGTEELARIAAADVQSSAGDKVRVQVISLPRNRGKAIALNEGCAAASSSLLLFADARQVWAPDAIDRLVANFADPEVGAVSGDLVVEAPPGAMEGVGLYWRFEKWLRRNESRFHSMVSVTGSISAVRRSLFQPIPEGTLLDDVYWPLTIAMTGRRVVHEARALAFDRLPERARDEFRRKVRTLAGNFQLIQLLPSALIPWRNRVWWPFISHRVLRLVAPWALLGMLFSSLFLSGRVYGTAAWLQCGFYLLALAGLQPRIARRSRLAAAAASFLVLNTAAWIGFWTWAAGRSSRAWTKVRYEEKSARPLIQASMNMGQSRPGSP